MSNFQFKQFSIKHDRCAMKVGTDSILLGAWANIDNAQRVLDLGTGSGLLALMLAQRSTSTTQIVGVELDLQAATQAKDNVEHSPWAQRIEIVPQNITHFVEDFQFHLNQKCCQSQKIFSPFDVIVANPPYFPQSIDCRSSARNQARYTLAESHLDWLNIAAECLTSTGQIHLVLPFEQGKILQKQTALYCIRECKIITKFGKPPQRILLTFSPISKLSERSELIIYNQRNQYTAEFIELTKDFYLKF